MAFDRDYLEIVHQGAGMNRWVYKTADTVATVNTSGYIDDEGVIARMGIGDIIDVIVLDSVTVPTSVSAVSTLVCVSNNGTTVDLSDGESIGVTDTD